MITLRPFAPEYIPALYALYLEVRNKLPQIELVVSHEQFARHLAISRLYTPTDWYNHDAEVAVVAEQNGTLVAYANGCLLREGDFLLGDNTAILRWVLARREYREAASQVIKYVLDHLQTFQPARVHAFNGMVTPIFFGNLGGGMPSEWAWIGECLIRENFVPDIPAYFMWRDLTKPDNIIETPTLPDGFEIHEDHTYVRDYLVGLERQYNLGYYLLYEGEFAGWCGNFYAGAFIEGAGYDYLYTHWFTIEEAFRGRGLGRLLLRHALSKAQERGAKGAILLTSVTNFLAFNLYVSEGYTPLTLHHSFHDASDG